MEGGRCRVERCRAEGGDVGWRGEVYGGGGRCTVEACLFGAL